MKTVRLQRLEDYIKELFMKLGLSLEDSEITADIYMEMTKRGVGHHDIYNLPSRIEGIINRSLNPKPVFRNLASFGGMEQWDGDNGLGELISHFAMERASSLAMEHGIGMCAMQNSNPYLCSAPYVYQAAKQGCIGIIMAKGVPSMGVPGSAGKIIGQSPIGFAFPVKDEEPVLLDICLAYASGEQLAHSAAENKAIPYWWGVDKDGNPTDSAAELLKGTKYPIGGHKGFGLAILCELLTGVMSGGLILDEDEEKDGIALKSTSHTAIAIRADGLMPMEEYENRSRELIDRIRARSEQIHIPGDGFWEHKQRFERAGEIELKDELIERLNGYASAYGIKELV